MIRTQIHIIDWTKRQLIKTMVNEYFLIGHKYRNGFLQSKEGLGRKYDRICDISDDFKIAFEVIHDK